MNKQTALLLKGDFAPADLSAVLGVASPERVLELSEALRVAAQRKRARRNHVVLALVLVDALVLFAAIFGFSLAYLGWQRGLEQALLLSALLPTVYALAALHGGAFRLKVGDSKLIPVWRALTALLYSSAILVLYVFLTKTTMDFSRVVVTGTIGAAFVGLAAGRCLTARWARGYIGERTYATLCIYDGVPMAEEIGFTRISAARFGLTADASDPEMIDRLASLSRDFDRLVIHCKPERRQEWAFILKSVSIPAEIEVPEIHALRPISIHQRSGKTSLLISTGPLQWHQRALKRGFDLLVVLAALPVLVPVFLVTALIIKLDSKGPVFFLQERIGLDNRPFRIFKFRSMRTDLLDFDGKQSTGRNDPRVTRVGSFLRSSSMDELPQLINVLKGDMSIVGPRPHARLSRAGERLFWEVDSAYWHRHVVKPGITGLAQIRGHRGNTFHEEHLRKRLNSDLEYVANWSLLGDIKIIFRTVFVLKHENAF